MLYISQFGLEIKRRREALLLCNFNELNRVRGVLLKDHTIGDELKHDESLETLDWFHVH